VERWGIVLSRLQRDEAGISLMEVLIAAAIGSIIATAFLVVFSAFSSSVHLEEARAGALDEVQATTSDLNSELRQGVPLEPGGVIVEKLEAAWPAPELIFYSDRFDSAPGPERYRYFVDNCTAALCDLMRSITVADGGTAPWTYTGSATVNRVVSNVLVGGAPLFQGSDWSTGSEVLTTACDLGTPCLFSLVELVLRVDPDPNTAAENTLEVRHQVRMRNAG